MRNFDKIDFFVLLSMGCGSAFAVGCSTPFGTAESTDTRQGSALQQQPPMAYQPAAGDNADTGAAGKDSNTGDTANATVGDAGAAVPQSYEVTTLAGKGAVESDASAPFNMPYGIALGPDGSLYVTDTFNNKILKIAANGTVSTYAGKGEAEPLTNGDCESATFYYPRGLAVDNDGNVYVADTWNHVIRKITATPTCQVTTLAGSGISGSDNGTPTAASFVYPGFLALDASGNLYVSDLGTYKIRKVTSVGNVSTIDATFNGLTGITLDKKANILYAAESINGDILKITFDSTGNTSNPTVTTLAGSADHACAWADGMGANAAFCNPYGMAIDASGNLYVADLNNKAMRKVSPAGEVTTIAGGNNQGNSHGPANPATTFHTLYDVAVDASGTIYVTDIDNQNIRKLTPMY